MKLIVTHLSPDLDAIASVWLVHRYMRGWKHAGVEFVSAGQTLNGMEPDSDPDIMHVDTGFGKFDHHQTSEYTCAARIVYEYIRKKNYIKGGEVEALERMVDVITRYDHFREALLPDADDDIHMFSITYVIFGLRINQDRNHRLVEIVEESLDGILQLMKSTVNAEKIIKEGHVFKSYWGKTLVLETDNDRAMKVAFKKGYDMVIRYSPQYKSADIKLFPTNRKKLGKLYKRVIKNDPDAQWFYHASGRMLLNASTRATKHKVTKYSLKELLKIIKSF